MPESEPERERATRGYRLGAAPFAPTTHETPLWPAKVKSYASSPQRRSRARFRAFLAILRAHVHHACARRTLALQRRAEQREGRR